MTTGKTIALTRWTFVGNVSAIFKKYAVKFGHNFSSREQASFNFMAAVTICSDFGAQENSLSLSIVSPSICQEVMGLDAMTLVFWMLSFNFFTLLFHFHQEAL